MRAEDRSKDRLVAILIHVAVVANVADVVSNIAPIAVQVTTVVTDVRQIPSGAPVVAFSSFFAVAGPVASQVSPVVVNVAAIVTNVSPVHPDVMPKWMGVRICMGQPKTRQDHRQRRTHRPSSRNLHKVSFKCPAVLSPFES
jgi:hypothetical protein